MKKKNHFLFVSLFLSLSLSSCSTAKVYDTFGVVGIAFIFLFLLFLLISIMFFIYKKWKEHKAALSVSQFNQNISRIVSKLDVPEEKIKALEYALKRVEDNKKYDSNPTWKNNLIVSVYLHMCKVYEDMGNDKKIVETCTRILKLKPDHAATYNNRGFVYSRLGKYTLAIEDYSSALKSRQSPFTYYNRANAYLETNEKGKAIEDLKAFLSIYAVNDADLINEVETRIQELEH